MKTQEMAILLEPWRTWLKWRHTWLFTQHSVFWLFCLGALLVLANKIVFLGWDGVLTCTICIASVIMLCLSRFLLTRQSLLFVCEQIDRAGSCHNLVATAYQLQAEDEPMAAPIRARAVAFLQDSSRHELLPLTSTWTGRFAYIPLIVMIAFVALPDWDVMKRRHQHILAEKEAESVREALVYLTEQLNEQHGESGDLLKAAEELQHALRGASKSEALQQLSEFEERHTESLAQPTLERPTDSPSSANVNWQELVDKLNQGGEALRQAAATVDNLASRHTETSNEDKQLQQQAGQLARQMGASPNAKESGLQALQKTVARRVESAAVKKGIQMAKNALLNRQPTTGVASRSGSKPPTPRAQLGASQKPTKGQSAKPSAGQAANRSGSGAGPLKGMGGGATEKGSQGSVAFVPTPVSAHKVPGQERETETELRPGQRNSVTVADYQETATLARQYARKQLSRTQVPREYETMIQTYFDNLDSPQP